MNRIPSLNPQRGAWHIAGLFIILAVVVAFIYLISLHMEVRAIHHELREMHEELRNTKGFGGT